MDNTVELNDYSARKWGMILLIFKVLEFRVNNLFLPATMGKVSLLDRNVPKIESEIACPY